RLDRADDLLDLRDRQGVLLTAEAEDDELAHVSSFGGSAGRGARTRSHQIPSAPRGRRLTPGCGRIRQLHGVSHQQSAVAFDAAIPPVLEIAPGETVRFETDDAVFERIAAGETMESIGAENVNVVSGPVAVRGAEPGDALRIEVLDVEIRR